MEGANAPVQLGLDPDVDPTPQVPDCDSFLASPKHFSLAFPWARSSVRPMRDQPFKTHMVTLRAHPTSSTLDRRSDLCT